MLAPDTLRALLGSPRRHPFASGSRPNVSVAAIYPEGHSFASTRPLGHPAEVVIHEIGSVTKVFTAAVLADLVLEGEVRLEDPVSRFLPKEVSGSWPAGGTITLEQLATHTSGLPRIPSNLAINREARLNPYAGYGDVELHAFLSGHRERQASPAPFRYSNLGSGLLGYVLAEIMGTTYDKAVRCRICAPLGMRDTAVRLDPERHARSAQGHSARGRPTPPWDFLALAGAGALRSTLHDLRLFLETQLGRSDLPVVRSLTFCHEPRRAVGRRQRIGLGWMVTDNGVGTVHWHTGATGGFSSHVGFVRDRGIGVAVLSDHTVPLPAALGLRRPPVERLGMTVLRALA